MAQPTMCLVTHQGNAGVFCTENPINAVPLELVLQVLLPNLPLVQGAG